jgi:hypothetical protein
MAKEPAEKSETSAAAVPLTVDDLAKLLPTLVQATVAAVQSQQPQHDVTAIQQAAASAAAEMFERGTGTIKQNPDYPGISAFNRDGEFKNPRPSLNGHVFWVGTPLHASELTREEIELVNALVPGEYHDGMWVVRDLAPGVKNPEHRRLSVEFQCRDNDQRQDLPKFVEMLREMVADGLRKLAAA